MTDIEFSYSWMLLLSLSAIAAGLLRWHYLKRRQAALGFSGYHWMSGGKSKPTGGDWIGLAFRVSALLILALLIAGLGGQRYRDVERLQPEALVIVLDASSSMTAEDFSPENRLAAAKSNLAEYISANSDLEIGLIQFAASPQLLVPVTRDLQAVRDTLETVRQAEHGEDGTAIGSGIASAVNRLRRGAWSHRRILLITDGVNNRGAVAPLDAARIAATLGIVVDAVGIGTGAVSRFWAPSAQGLPVQVEAQIDIDDMALEELAHETGGSYRRVEDSDELSEALSSLGRLQATTASERIREFDPRWLQMFMVLAITMICLEFIFSRFTLRELPGL